MTIHECLMKAIQDDARRAGERGQLLREARRGRRARRQRVVRANVAGSPTTSPSPSWRPDDGRPRLGWARRGSGASAAQAS